MREPLQFKTREDFRNWLEMNGQSHEGVWLLFEKTKVVSTLKASEALEEALCYGWIDGMMKSLDDNSYIKYFSARRTRSKWSDKNKLLFEVLEKTNQMTDFGRAKYEEAKKNGQWDFSVNNEFNWDDKIDELTLILEKNELAVMNFKKMSPSVRKTYTRAYFDAKTEAGRIKRLVWLVDRLERNLKPM